MHTVLVVDDSASDRRAIGGLLSQSPNLRVIFAEDGAQGLARLAESLPDLVLSDLAPGLALLREVRRRHPDLPVVLLTGDRENETAVEALRLGAAGCVPKGSLATLLVETLESALETARQLREQERLAAAMKEATLSYDIGVDDSLLPPLLAHLQQCLLNVGVCDESDAMRVSIALDESLRNALYHGNLEITSAQRDGDPDEYERLLHERKNTSPYRERSLLVEARIGPREAVFVVRDQGKGFDPSKLPDPTDPENLDRVSGRGVLLMRSFMDDVRFSAKGNEVTMIKRASQESPLSKTG